VSHEWALLVGSFLHLDLFVTTYAGFDNRISALETDRTQYSFAVPSEGGDIDVKARLVYRRSWRFLVDAKQWTEDGHGNALADIAAPHFGHLMEEANAP
jgi:hypothetical protein